MPTTTLATLPNTGQPSRVGRWPSTVPTGGGELWDDVLEYRVRVPVDGRTKLHAFGSYADAEAYAAAHPAASPIVALIRQANWFLPDAAGRLIRHRGERLSEWAPCDLAGRFATRQAIEKLVAAPAILYVDPKADEPAILSVRTATERRNWTTVSLAKPASPGDALRAAKQAAKVRKAAIAAKRR